MSSMGYCLGKL